MTATELINGYLLARIMRPAAAVDMAVVIVGIVIAAVAIGVGLFLCWDLGKTMVSDLAKIGWVIIFFVLPLYSWIAYWLLIKKG